MTLSSPDGSLSPLHSPPALHPVALVDDQVSVTDSLTHKVVGSAEIEAVGAGGGVGTGAGSEPPPPPPPHDDKKTVVRIKDKTLATI